MEHSLFHGWFSWLGGIKTMVGMIMGHTRGVPPYSLLYTAPDEYYKRSCKNRWLKEKQPPTCYSSKVTNSSEPTPVLNNAFCISKCHLYPSTAMVSAIYCTHAVHFHTIRYYPSLIHAFILSVHHLSHFRIIELDTRHLTSLQMLRKKCYSNKFYF